VEINIIGSGSLGNCYRISDGTTALLIDAGLPAAAIQRACGFNLSSIKGCLISHQHGDHVKGVKQLERYGMWFYGSAETFDACKLEGFQYQPVEPMTPFDIGTFTIMAFDLHHDVRNYGYRVKSKETGEQLIYITDSFYCDYVFPGTHYFMVECNYSIEAINDSISKGYIPESMKSRLLNSHMSLEHFIEMMKANDLRTVKAIYLLHMSANNSRADEFKKAVQKAAGCEVYVA
jgi:phosphoribosyl 1,2-cyclic phosphodiesterase